MLAANASKTALLSGRAARVLSYFAWLAVLFLTPLSLPPGVLKGSVEALGQVTSFRAGLVGVGLVICALAYVAVAPAQSRAQTPWAKPPT